MDFFSVLALLGGLAIFLYGMNLMGDGLAKVAGGKLERILETLTSSPIRAVLLGMGVTAVIQSSSATTVMVVGFVNSGIMKLSQVVGIIMGANIGTTVTSWILSLTGIQSDNFIIRLFKPTSFSPILALVGVILIMFTKSQKKKDVGTIFVGFAILMYGMSAMSGAVEPLADVPEFTGMLVKFSNPLLGVVAGAVLTAIIQSSSASGGILQALCLTGMVPFSAALPIIMGQNIGTCVTALLSSVGASKNAKRAALVHLYFNVIGTVLCMIGFYSLYAFLHFGFLAQAATPAGIAIIHSCFNIGATVILLPFARGLEKLAMLTVREDKEEKKKNEEFANLDERFLETPSLALEQCKVSVDRMAVYTRDNILRALATLGNYSKEEYAKIEQVEQLIDRYEENVTEYLHKIMTHSLLEKDGEEANKLLYCIRDFERISDHACNIVEQAEKIEKAGEVWPEKTVEQLQEYAGEVGKIVTMTAEAFVEEDPERIHEIEEKEDHIDEVNKKIKKQNMKRMKKEKCAPAIGIFINELSINFERVADHCENIAISLGESSEA